MHVKKCSLNVASIYRPKRRENDAANVSAVREKITAATVHLAAMISHIKSANRDDAKSSLRKR